MIKINAPALQELISEAVSTCVCDVADPEQVEAGIGEILDDSGPVERLIHCVVIMPAVKLAIMVAETTNFLMTANGGGTENVVQVDLRWQGMQMN